MNAVDTKKVAEIFHEFALDIAQEVHDELIAKRAVVQNQDGSLTTVPYVTNVVDGKDHVSVVPAFDNTVDAYGNSDTILKNGFDGSNILRNIVKKLTKR